MGNLGDPLGDSLEYLSDSDSFDLGVIGGGPKKSKTLSNTLGVLMSFPRNLSTAVQLGLGTANGDGV